MKPIIAVLLMIILIAGCSKSYDGFAQCLTDKGVKMYGTEWCPHCQNQKAKFGSSFSFVSYIDCDRQKEACRNAGVSGYPTWIIDGASYPGEQPLYRLADLSGCELKEDD